MARNILFRLCVLIFIFGLLALSCSDAVSQHNSNVLSGYWEGSIYPECGYIMVLHFFHEEGKQTGCYYLFQDKIPIQQSLVQDIKIHEQNLSFCLHGNTTPFEGKIDTAKGILAGSFYFPGGDPEPVVAKHVSKPSRSVPGCLAFPSLSDSSLVQPLE